MTPAEQKELRLFAVKVREGILRGTHAAKSGHPGGSLSSTEYFTYLYNREIRIDPKNPHIRTVTALCSRRDTSRPVSMRRSPIADSFQWMNS